MLIKSSLPSKSNREVLAAHCACIAELGDKTSVGFLIKSAQTYNPKTVLPEPGGATTWSLVSPASSCGIIFLLAACCEGRKVPAKWMLPKSGSGSGMFMLHHW